MTLKKPISDQWRNQGVQTKITLGLLTIALLVVVVGGLGIWSSYQISALSQKIGTESAPALLSAQEMKSQTLRLQQEVLSYTLLRSNPPFSNKVMQEMDQSVANYHDAKRDFLKALETHQRLDTVKSHPEIAGHEKVAEAFTNYWTLATALMNDAPPTNAAVFENLLNQSEDDLLRYIDGIIEHESDHIIEAQETLAKLTSQLMLLNISVIITSLLLAFAIAYHTSKTIVNPILDLKAAAIRLGQGRFLSKDKPLDAAASSDEIGVLARAFTDMSDNLERLNSDLHHNANHDVLTGLANRKYLLETLEARLSLIKEGAQSAALLFLDFDRFKTINDYYGHQVGDGLLSAVSVRLQETVRDDDLVARLGGDEFTVLLAGVESERGARDMARRILQALRRPFKVGEFELRMSASIGIVLIDASFGSALDILRDADIAMYRAKAKGTGQFEVFTEGLREETFEVMELENDLRYALKSGGLNVHYQPIIALESAQVVGTEALVRWHHPERGAIFPDQFIPIAEETGLILELDRFVMRAACEQTVRWNEQFGTQLGISVNLSGQQFSSPNLVQDVRDVLLETGLEPDLLHLEMTETILMHQTDLTLDVLQALKALGVTLHMDDFGTGYSSLAYLQRFDVDTLKIDRTFIDQMLESCESGALVRTILAMAETLNLKVVAEGVETQAQAEHLSELGCRYAQGYLFSRPHAAESLEAYLLETLNPALEAYWASEQPEANL